MTLDDLLKLAKRTPRVEAVPIGDDVLHVRGLTAGDLAELVAYTKDDDLETMDLLTVTKAACDAEGQSLFGDIKSGTDKLSGLPAMLVHRLARVVDRLSDVEPGGAGELLGNSGERTADSSNDSR